MKIEEAIKTIEIAIAEVEWDYPMEYAVAFEIAIAALRAQQAIKDRAWECKDHMTVADAVETVQYAAAFNAENGPLTKALSVLVAAARAQQERENPKPLTLDELREMEGEPAYDGLSHNWHIICAVTEDEVVMDDGAYFAIYEVIGRFYRNKPKED